MLEDGYHIFARPDPDPNPDDFITYEVNGSLTLESGAVVVVERRVWVVAEAGETITCETGSRVVLEGEAELLCDPSGTVVMNTDEVIFQGPGACIATNGGTLQLGANVTLTVNRGGLLWNNTTPGSFVLGSGATIEVEEDGFLRWSSSGNWSFGANSTLNIYGTIEVKDGVQLSFPASSNVNAYSGSQFTMSDNASLVFKGKASISANQVDPVVFSLESGESAWSGIKLETGADAMFSYCEISGTSLPFRIKTPLKTTIQYCTITSPTTGIQIVPDLGQGPAPTHQINIKNNTITYVSSIGISVQDYSDLLIEGNTMTGTLPPSGPGGGTGIYCSGASPTILGNNLSSFYRGIRCINQSSPVLENGQYGGNNIIKDNTLGVVCDNGSNAILGLLTQDPDDGGQNSIFNNSSYNLYLTNNSIVSAQNNWWGADPPDTLKFFKDGTSSLTYTPYLDSDPNGPSAPIGGGPKGNQIAGLGGGTSPEMDPLGDHLLMNEALTARINGDHLGALRILAVVIANPEESTEVKSWAVSEVLANAMRLENNDVSAYLVEVKGLYANLFKSVNQALVTVMIDESEFSDAIVQMDSNIVRYPNSVLEATGLYGRFSVALFRDEDLTLAQTYLDALLAEYPRSGEAELAQSQMELAQLDGMNRWSAPISSMVSEKPEEFRLFQNFPNPFNPTTAIEYQLPDDSRVSLRIYDILGREVLTLVNETKQAGYHKATLDARNLASGMYFYRLTADSFTEVKKMLVLK